MKRIPILIYMSTFIVFLPLGKVSAELSNYPYSTKSKCVNWFREGVSDGQWLEENDRFWRYYGDLKPYMQSLSIRLRLLTDDDGLHVINGKGEQNHFSTRLMYAYKESKCTSEIGGRCYGNID